MSTELKVHLDHLIRRQSIRYSRPIHTENQEVDPLQKSDPNIRLSDIQQEDGWFSRLLKPDFQRATSAWTPDGCADFLSSVVRQRIIPSIILWRNHETGQVYVLDGAHRLSVLRAWMTDDWGDKASDFYLKSENHKEIISTAALTRGMVNSKVGSFADFFEAEKELWQLTIQGEAPKQIMSPDRFSKAKFYSDIVNNRTLHAQWEAGNYEAAEESFLAINRQGARLDDLESNLIEYRNGSFSRITMSIANAGAPGHYWPKPTNSDEFPQSILSSVASFDARCNKIHNTLFVPPFDSKILDINVPFMVAPGHFRKHQYLIETLPLLLDGSSVTKENITPILSKDYKSSPQDIIINTEKTISTLEDKISHISNNHNNPNALSIVPLIYWYNKQGSFVRALFYGFCHWLLSGDAEDVKVRKIAFSAVRGELEKIFINYKNEISDIQHRGGAGVKSTSKISETIQDIVEILINEKNMEVAESKISEFLGTPKKTEKKKNTGRSFTTKSKAEINIREMLISSVKCQICDGIVDLKQSVQYDHIDHYSKSLNSSPTNGRPTHPFCNLFREKIAEAKKKKQSFKLPALKNEHPKNQTATQLTLFDSFPGF